MQAVIRKLVTVLEETRCEMGRAVDPPTRRAAALAVILSSFAGRYVEDLAPLMMMGEELGCLLGERALAALASPEPQPRATARRRRWARTASSSTPRPSCIPGSASPCAHPWEEVPP